MKLSSHKPTMLTLNVLIFILAIAPSLISVNVLFPTRYGVRMINEEKLNYIMKKAVSCVCLFFEAGFDTIISDHAWLHFSYPKFM